MKCSSRRIPDAATPRSEVATWEYTRTEGEFPIALKVTTDDPDYGEWMNRHLHA